MKIRAVPVGCMPSGRYGSRIGLIRRTENAIRNCVSFLYLTVYYYATLFLSVHNFISNHSRRCALVFPKRNGLSRHCFVSCRCRCRPAIKTSLNPNAFLLQNIYTTCLTH